MCSQSRLKILVLKPGTANKSDIVFPCSSCLCKNCSLVSLDVLQLASDAAWATYTDNMGDTKCKVVYVFAKEFTNELGCSIMALIDILFKAGCNASNNHLLVRAAARPTYSSFLIPPRQVESFCKHLPITSDLHQTRMQPQVFTGPSLSPCPSEWLVVVPLLWVHALPCKAQGPSNHLHQIIPGVL